MRYLNFAHWVVANGETWEKYVCGDPQYKMQMLRKYAIYVGDNRQAAETLKLDKPMKEGNEMNLLEMLEKAMEETLDAMGSLKTNKFKADLKEAIEEVSKTSNDLKEASNELHFYTYAGLANMYEDVQNIIEESTETNKEIYSSLEELTNDDDAEIKMLAHELIAKTIYFEAELKNYGPGILLLQMRKLNHRKKLFDCGYVPDSPPEALLTQPHYDPRCQQSPFYSFHP